MRLWNRRGSVLILALVLSLAVLPAAVLLASLAQTDLAAALDDYHRTRAVYAAQGALFLIGEDLARGGDGRIIWPDPDISLETDITDTGQTWAVIVSARSGRAVSQACAQIPKE